MVSSSSEDRALIRDAAKGFLADQSTGADVRRVMAMDAGYDPAQWQKVAAELGWPGLLIPEAHGGLALGAADLAVLIEEMGAAMFCAPFFATSGLATPALVSNPGCIQPPAAPGPGTIHARNVANIMPMRNQSGLNFITAPRKSCVSQFRPEFFHQDCEFIAPLDPQRP